MNCLATVTTASILLTSSVIGDTLNDRSPTLALAQTKDVQTKNAPAASDPNKNESDEEVLRFVSEHQPKLLELLNFLKAKNSPQYQSAMKDISRSKLRLESLAKRDTEMYAIELELWQIRSKLRLVAAETSVAATNKKDDLQKQLSELVADELEQDLAKLKLQHTRATKLAEQLENQIQQRQVNHEEQIAKALKLWQNRIAKDK